MKLSIVMLILKLFNKISSLNFGMPIVIDIVSKKNSNYVNR